MATELLATNHPTYLARMARLLNTHEHVYHKTLGRLIAGRYRVYDGRLYVRRFETGNEVPVHPEDLYDGHTRQICASRHPTKPRMSK